MCMLMPVIMWARLLTYTEGLYKNVFECIQYTADCVLRNIRTNAFLSHLKLFFLFFFKADLSFFIVRPAIIKKNILMTQRAEGIRVEKKRMDMPKSYQTV